MPALTGEHSASSSQTVLPDSAFVPNGSGNIAADTIRILVATDSHVGYNERDPIRGDDSWRSFHEVMCLAKERDVDMVLLAGDLFHENKPSRKSMFQVMRSLRMNCYGEKPCELEMLSDGSETFQGAFNHVNYEDPDINVAIPVFSIHGNHDDPTGEGHLAALDLLQTAGLVNYYGRTPESDNIEVKPVLLQKGNTKLALYGMSNVRDERLFRTFRDQKVKFFRPGVQKEDWFNLMSVHQNQYVASQARYLRQHPNEFLVTHTPKRDTFQKSSWHNSWTLSYGVTSMSARLILGITLRWISMSCSQDPQLPHLYALAKPFRSMSRYSA